VRGPISSVGSDSLARAEAPRRHGRLQPRAAQHHRSALLAAALVLCAPARALADEASAEEGRADEASAEEGEEKKATGDLRRTDAELDAQLGELKRQLAAEEAKFDDISKSELYTALFTQPLRVRLAGRGPSVDPGDGVAGGLMRIDARIGWTAPVRKDTFFASVGGYTSGGSHVILAVGGLRSFGDQRKSRIHPFLGFRTDIATRKFSSVPFVNFGGMTGLRFELSSAVMATLGLDPMVVVVTKTDTAKGSVAFDLNMALGLELIL